MQDVGIDEQVIMNEGLLIAEYARHACPDISKMLEGLWAGWKEQRESRGGEEDCQGNDGRLGTNAGISDRGSPTKRRFDGFSRQGRQSLLLVDSAISPT